MSSFDKKRLLLLGEPDANTADDSRRKKKASDQKQKKGLSFPSLFSSPLSQTKIYCQIIQDSSHEKNKGKSLHKFTRNNKRKQKKKNTYDCKNHMNHINRILKDSGITAFSCHFSSRSSLNIWFHRLEINENNHPT